MADADADDMDEDEVVTTATGIPAAAMKEDEEDGPQEE